MKVCPLTRISSLAPEICSNVLLSGDVFYTERVFLYRHGPTEHTVILVSASIFFQVFLFTSISCHWVDGTGLQPSSQVLGLLW